MNKILILAALSLNLAIINAMVSKDINVDLLSIATIEKNLKENGFRHLAEETTFLDDIKNKTDIISVFTEITFAVDAYLESYKERNKAVLLRNVLKDPEPSIKLLKDVGALK